MLSCALISKNNPPILYRKLISKMSSCFHHFPCRAPPPYIDRWSPLLPHAASKYQYGIDSKMTEPKSYLQIQERKERNFWRFIASLCLSIVILQLPIFDNFVISAWTVISQKSWFRHDMFEPVLAVGSFFIWVHAWYLLDILVMHKRSPRWLQRLRRYRLQDRVAWGDSSKLKYPATDVTEARQSIAANRLFTSIEQVDDLIDSTTASSSYDSDGGLPPVARSGSTMMDASPQPSEIAALTEKKRVKLARAVKLSPWYRGWYWEMVVYLAPLWGIATFTDLFSPRRLALQWSAPALPTIAFQIFTGLFLYDFFFYFGHLLLHKLPQRLYSSLHGKHHVNREVRAADTVRLTVPEEIFDVVCSISALRLLRAHPLSRSLYNIIITFLLVELHCGYDMPWSPQNIFPAIFAGSRRHHEHHRSGRRYYQKFFRYLDDSVGKLIS